MIQQHTESTRKPTAIAQQKGVTLPQTIGAENQILLNQLQPLSGTRFDQVYMSSQLTAHRRAEAEFRRELQQRRDAAVRGFANQTLPVITAHRQMVESMVANR